MHINYSVRLYLKMKKSNRQRRPFGIRSKVTVNYRDYSGFGKIWKSHLPFNTLNQVKEKYEGYETRQNGKRIYNAFFLPGLRVKFYATRTGKIIRLGIEPTIEEFYIWAKSEYSHNLEYSHNIYACFLPARNKTLFAPDDSVFLITTVIIPELKISTEIMVLAPMVQYKSILGAINRVEKNTITVVSKTLNGSKLNDVTHGLNYERRPPSRGGYQVISVSDTYFSKCNISRMQVNPHPDYTLF